LDSASPWRWHASFSIFREYQTTPKPMPHKGSILLHVETKHVVLVDIDEKVVDARYLKEGESINPGSVFNFACHMAHIGERILQPGAYIEDASVVTPNQVTIPRVMSLLWTCDNV
jgi:hypothetical protein